MQKKEPGQTVFCTGSLYLIGELEKIAGGLKKMIDFEEELKNFSQALK